MDNNVQLTIYAATLKHMNVDQFKALQENVLADGRWETAKGCVISGTTDYISVEPLDGEAKSMIYLGIEKDGYTHS